MCFSFAPGELESGLFITREGSIGGSEDVVQPRAAVQRVDSVRFESDNVRSRRGRVVVCVALDDREKAGGCGARVEAKNAAMFAKSIVVTIIGFRWSLRTVFRT